MSTRSYSGTWESRASSPTSERVVVRQARAADVDAILRLLARVAGERRWLGTEPPLELEDRRRRYLANLEPGSGAGFVAYNARKRLIGELSLWPADASTAVLGMIVAKRWRGRGVGRQLMEAAVAWAKRVRLRRLELAVFPHNAAALALYRKFGFNEIAYQERAMPRKSGEVWDVILMRKEI